MRLPTITFRNSAIPTGSALLCLLLTLAPRGHSQIPASTNSALDREHQSEQWAEIERHLPDRHTASAVELEQEADILRARRFPEDALQFYRDAQDRGGNTSSLLNKIGLTELEMQHFVLAKAYFQRVVKLDSKNSEAWNNLGAVEFIDGELSQAISHYKRAIKIKKHEAVFHANLATAYFGVRNYKAARREMTAALTLDPEIFERRLASGGVAAHVLSAEDKARLAFEMARLYAQAGREEPMLHSLAEASEAGIDIRREMRRDPSLAHYVDDPRVLVLVRNAQLLRAGSITPDATADAAPLAHPL